MKIIFGLSFDSGVTPDFVDEGEAIHGQVVCGPMGLLSELELRLGLTGIRSDNIVRVEQIRQAIKRLDKAHYFFSNSFKQDGYSVAKAILEKRDELALAGFGFEEQPSMPTRLKDLCVLEKEATLGDGVAARVDKVIKNLSTLNKMVSIDSHTACNELPPYIKRLFSKLEEVGSKVSYLEPSNECLGKGDLLSFQHHLMNPSTEKVKFVGDGSLELWRTVSELDLAEYMAAYLANGEEKPTVYLSASEDVLNECFMENGLSSIGSSRSSKARASLQLPSLLQAFLWEPMDLERVLEFLTLPVKPLNNLIARGLAKSISIKPGIGSDEWEKRLVEAKEKIPEEKLEKALSAYQMLFERKRYRYEEEIPILEVCELYAWLGKYCHSYSQMQLNEHSAVLGKTSLACSSLVNVLSLMSDVQNSVGKLFLEKLVSDMILEVTAANCPEQVGRFDCIKHPASLRDAIPTLIWYPFVQKREFSTQSFWSKKERTFLKERGIELEDLQAKNVTTLTQYVRMITKVTGKVILGLPSQIKGETVQSHSLFVDLRSMAENLDVICKQPLADRKNKQIVLHDQIDLPKIDRILSIASSTLLKERGKESYSSLEKLFYYPCDWFLNYVAKIKNESPFEISDKALLYGNVTHGLIEAFFLENKEVGGINDALIDDWIGAHFTLFIEKEAMNILLPGRENDLLMLESVTLSALNNLVAYAKNNGWETIEPEVEFESEFCGVKFGGFADLVFRKKDELAIIDMKWGNKTKRSKQLEHNEDLQLGLYARLFENSGRFAHTAFYIINSKVLLAKNKKAFKEAEVPKYFDDADEAYQDLWDKMEATYKLRIEEIKAGTIEVVNDETLNLENPKYETSETIDMAAELDSYSDYKNVTNWRLEDDK